MLGIHINLNFMIFRAEKILRIINKNKRYFPKVYFNVNEEAIFLKFKFQIIIYFF